MTVLRDVNEVEEEMTVHGLKTGMKLEGTSSRGLGIRLALDEEHAVVADSSQGFARLARRAPAPAPPSPLSPESPFTTGTTFTASFWTPSRTSRVALSYSLPSARRPNVNLTIDADQIGWIHAINYVVPLALQEPENAIRKTTTCSLPPDGG